MTATQELPIFATGFSVTYDPNTNLVQTLSYLNSSSTPITVTLLHQDVAFRSVTAPPGTTDLDVSSLKAPLSLFAKGLPAGWALHLV